MGSGTLYNLLARVVFLVSGYALQFSLARWLPTAADYGRFGILVGLVTLARTVLSTGLPQAITQFAAAAPAEAEGIYRRGAVLQLASACGVWLTFAALVPTLVDWLGDPALQPLMFLVSPLIVLMAFYQVNLGYITGKLWFGRQALLTVVYSIARYAASAVLVLAGFGVRGAVWGMLLATLVVALLSRLPITSTRATTSIPIGQFLAFSWPLVIFSFGVSALLNLDLVLLGRYFPASEDVGFYSGAVNLGKAPYFVFYAFSTTALPTLSRMFAAGNLDELRTALSRQLRFLLLGALPCAGGLAVASAPSLAFVYGGGFVAAAPALALLAVSTCALSVLVVLASSLTACGKPHISMLLMISCLPVQAALGVWLIPGGGMAGAALSNLLATLFGCSIALVLVRRMIGSVWDLRALAGTLVSTAAASVAALGVLRLGSGLALVLMSGLACYAVMLWLTGAVRPEELAEISRRALHRTRTSDKARPCA